MKKRSPIALSLLLSRELKEFAAASVLIILLCSGLAAQEFTREFKDLKSALDHSVGEIKAGTFKNVHSFLVSQNGKTVLEEYFDGQDKNALHTLQSQTKSVVALLFGIAVDRGYIKDEHTPVGRFFPEFAAKGDSLKAAVTVRDLLTMSAGMAWEEMLPPDDPHNDNMNMFRSPSYVDYVLARPMAKPPFSEFKYNSGCPMIVAGIIQKAAKRSLDKFAEEALFGPLGIRDYRWLKDSTGMPHAGGGLNLRPSDMLKIGELVLNEGRWNDQQIVSKGWIEKATRSYFETSFGHSGYGYFWWTEELEAAPGRKTKVISARGAGGQYMYIVPEYHMVVSFTERNYATPTVGAFILGKIILPTLGRDAAVKGLLP